MSSKRLRNIVKIIIPDSIIRLLSGIFYGWHGNYKSWQEAKESCSGYDSGIIIEKVRDSSLKIKEGKAVYERDSFIFEEIQYSFPLLSSLMWIAAQNNGKLTVLDFGGSLGSSYYQNKKFLDSLNEVHWCIVEQPQFVKTGLDNFESKELHFFYSIDDCLKSHNVDIVLLSSVLQYIEEPYQLLEKIKQTGLKYVLIDRTPFISGPDRITVQKVNPAIYKASYPCWFFNEEKFVKSVNGYKMLFEFKALDRSNIKSEFKGFLFEKD